MQQKLLQTARLTGLALSPTANPSGCGIASCGSLNVSSNRGLVSSGSARSSCGGTGAGRPQTVPRSLSRLGMRRSADSPPTAAAAAAAAAGKCPDAMLCFNSQMQFCVVTY